jgi:hypothetical protein
MRRHRGGEAATERPRQRPAEDHQRGNGGDPQRRPQSREQVGAVIEREQDDGDQRKRDEDLALRPPDLAPVYLGAEADLAPHLGPRLEGVACSGESSQPEHQVVIPPWAPQTATRPKPPDVLAHRALAHSSRKTSTANRGPSSVT